MMNWIWWFLKIVDWPTVIASLFLGAAPKGWHKFKSWLHDKRNRKRHNRFMQELNALDTSKYDDEIAKMIKPFVQPQKQTSTQDKTNKQ